MWERELEAGKKQSEKRLIELQQGASPELYNFVLRHTNGYLREKRLIQLLNQETLKRSPANV